MIVPTNTDLNRGDQALVWESIKIIKEIDSEADFRLINTGETEEEKTKQSFQSRKMGYEFVSPLIKHPGRGEKEKNNQYYSKYQYVSWGIQAIADAAPRLLLLSKNKMLNRLALKILPKDFLETYVIFKESKAVIFKGGGFIHSYGSITDPYIMFFLLYYAMLAKKHNISVIFMPNSFGPFKNKWATKLVKRVLSKVDVITVREKISQTVLSDLLSDNIPFYPDLGFFMEPDHSFEVDNYLENKNILKYNKKVGITVRPYRFDGHPNPKKAYQNYIDSFVTFINYLTEKGYFPILIAQTMGPSYNEDDNEAINLIASQINDKGSFSIISDLALNAKEIKKIYASMDYVVGTRFHSVIFSLSSEVPSIAVSYGGNKGKGIMKELGLDDYEISIENLSSDFLIEKFKSMEINKDKYITTLRIKMNEYLKLREQLKKEIKSYIHN